MYKAGKDLFQPKRIVMDARLQRRIQRYGWDKAASYYAQYWQKQLEPAQTRLITAAHLVAGESVLDIACGSGFFTFRILEMVMPGGSVLGTDISDGMISIARKAAEENRLSQVSFERMEAEELSVPDESFDVVICSLGLMYVTDSKKVIEEMYRSLKPGGRMAALVWGEREQCGWADIFPIVDARVASEVCPMFFQLGTNEILKMIMGNAGFKNIKMERFKSDLSYHSADEACGAAFVGGPVAMAYSRFNEETKMDAQSEYLVSIEPYRNGTGYRVPGEFVICVGYK